MFDKNTYISRRQSLKNLMGSGILIFPGNNESPANGPYNFYHHRQDSTFLYFFGQEREGLIGVIDIDNDTEYLFGDDIDINDIIWFGSIDNVSELAEQVGINKTLQFNKIRDFIEEALLAGRTIHFLPPYRHDTQIFLHDLLGINPRKQKEAASVELIKAVVKLRSTKSKAEIKEIERACAIGYKMHTAAIKLASPAVTEHFISGIIEGIANSLGAMVSFPNIVTTHGEVMHGYPSDNYLEAGRLLLCDAGAETNENYCSDNTRTVPVSRRFTNKQKEIYTIVEQCHDLALNLAKPGIKWFDVHMEVCRHMTNCLKQLGLMKGDTEEAVQAGAHALFLPHGLGHMMGMDVHDMESLGQVYVGFDDEIQPSSQFGTSSLRMGRKLEEGFIVTDEPGIYFIPALIDLWKKNNTNAEFLNFDAIDKYRNFGGIRIEDDVLITAEGSRMLGHDIIPYHLDEIEEYMSKHRYE